MNSHSEIMPIKGANAINPAPFKTRLFALCYLTAVDVATLGWFGSARLGCVRACAMVVLLVSADIRLAGRPAPSHSQL
jgi:hypothetical protein